MEKSKWIQVMNKRSKREAYNNKNMYDFQDEMKNMKKILCNNMTTSNFCQYGDKCMYAHGLEDQNVDPIRKKAYNIIKGIEKINYKPDRDLSRTLLQLTKICKECSTNNCAGGYNCKYGVFNKIYQVCGDDLRYGICYNTSCNNIHLTNKGLLPLNSSVKSQPLRVIKYVDQLKNINIPCGTLLSDDFFLNLKNNTKDTTEDNPSEDSDESDISEESKDRIKAYLDYNSDSDRSCEESIFLPIKKSIYQKIEKY